MVFRRSLRASQRGTTIIEVVIASAIMLLLLGFATEAYVSNVKAQARHQEWVQMIDQSDLAKTWFNTDLQAADMPLQAASASSIQFSAIGTCYLLSLDTSTQTLNAQQISKTTDPTCATVSSQPKGPIAQWVINTDGGADPLFVLKDASGTVLTPGPGLDVTTVRQVSVMLHLSEPTSLATAPIEREYDITLGGQFLSGAPPDSSVTTAKLATGAVTGPKLSTQARTSFFTVPLVAGSSDAFTVPAPGGWFVSPNTLYARAGITLSDYCLTEKALYARGLFVVRNGSGGAQSLRFKLVRYAALSGSMASDYLSMPTPTGTNVPASRYATVTTDWTAVDCGASDVAAPYFYEAQQTPAGSPGTSGVTVAAVALQFRYQ